MPALKFNRDGFMLCPCCDKGTMSFCPKCGVVGRSSTLRRPKMGTCKIPFFVDDEDFRVCCWDCSSHIDPENIMETDLKYGNIVFVDGRFRKVGVIESVLRDLSMKSILSDGARLSLLKFFMK